MVTLKDIAREVNRSVTTVSRALAGCSDVSPDTVSLVRATADRMGYVPNTLARRLQKRSSDTIGIVAPVSSKGYADSFFCEFLSGIGEEVSEHGLDLLVAYAKEKHELESYRKLVSEQRVDGFILVRTLRSDPRIAYLSSVDVPFAAFGRTEGEQCFPYVDEDGEYAMALLADHLVERGHRRIACIGPPASVMFSSLRLKGMGEALRQKGLSPDDFLVREGSFDQKDGYARANELLDLPDPPTAIVAFNDSIAFGVINAVKERGLKVGRDVAVTGFDDIPMACMYRPPLTTIRQPVHDIGVMVTRLLLDVIDDRNADLSSRQIVLKPQLIVREST